MNCEYQIKGNTLRIYIPKELDHHISDSLREEADLLTEAYFIRSIIFDFPVPNGWTVPASASS
mgnify:CR=1 FL=1